MELEKILQNERINTGTHQSLEGWEENGILLLEIAGKQALDIWKRLVERAPAAGYWPVITTMKNVDYLTENVRDESVATARDEVLAFARQLTFDGWLKQQRDPAYHVAKWLRSAERMEKIPGGDFMVKMNRDMAESWRNRPPYEFDPASCPWPDEPVHIRPLDERYSTYYSLDDFTTDSAAVLFVPTTNSCEVPAHLLFGGFNSCPPPEAHIAMLQAMRERYGASLHLLDSGTIEIVVSRRPSNREEALRLAKDFTTYAESFEATGNDQQTEGHIAAYLMASDYWGFWWD